MEYSNQDVPISSTLMDGQPYAENTDMVRAFSPNEVQQFAGGSNDEGEEEDWEDTTTDNDEQEPKIPTISQHHIHSRGARHRATVATYSSYSRRKNNIQRPSLRSVPRITESSCRFGPRCQAVVLARAHGKTSLGPVPPVQSHAQYEPLLSPPPQCSADHPMQPGVQDLPLWYGPRLDLPSLRELAQAAKSEQATSKANNTAL
ncbi:hypothetical protein BC939DRAFT_271577 [Gamsiella multidivaricata]|uniref:uncharacterized protein n=1 Tax=Gamsiella multidivaricata TaxID=101098 RepID=UPI00221F61B2|nr:uncharacterized protein BC939DRAFT_271577 [Gamsiella multidivaricata]KAI7819081.1 hypothetical protein BC939DRAFT_271577 [Gamsiella multidivaricata]